MATPIQAGTPGFMSRDGRAARQVGAVAVWRGQRIVGGGWHHAGVPSVVLRDETATGREIASWELPDIPERITARELGVTSIAADPRWTDRGEDRFHDYWQQASFGDLLPSAEV